MTKCNRCGGTFHDKDMIKSRYACKPCWRAYMRFKRYGITQEEYQRLYDEQGGKCAICGGDNKVMKKNGNHVFSLAVDHDPGAGRKGTGRVRGLLCGSCNRGIGYLRHSAKLLSAAARYLATQ